MDNILKLCRIIRSRSIENGKSVKILSAGGCYGQVLSILRQELDSMVRCIYLLNSSDLDERERLSTMTIQGVKWRTERNRVVTDRDMVELANELQGWTRSVYKFGCSFIHLSNFHDYNENDPFEYLKKEEKQDIKEYLHHYHGFDLNKALTFESIRPYLVMVFDKISSNLECCVKNLENNDER